MAGTNPTKPPSLEDVLREAVRDNRPQEADRLRQAMAENCAIMEAIDRMDYGTADRLADAKRVRLANDRER